MRENTMRCRVSWKGRMWIYRQRRSNLQYRLKSYNLKGLLSKRYLKGNRLIFINTNSR